MPKMNSKTRNARRPLVSIVMLCHNDGRYLMDCLGLISTYTDARRTPYEIIVVDNASQDGSRTELRRLSRSGRIRLIENPVNRYFAGGNNQGVRIAKGDYVLLFNPDTLVGPEWLERLVRCAEAEADTGVVGPYTNGSVGSQLVTGAAYAVPQGFPRFAREWAERYDGLRRETHRLIGFCLLVPRRTLHTVGLLDERFGPGGYEDYDYCMRVRQAGLTVVIAEDVFIHHYGGKGYVGMDYDALRHRNREILARKWCAYSVNVLDELDQFLVRKVTRSSGGPSARATARPKRRSLSYSRGSN